MSTQFPEKKFRALKDLGVGEFAHLNGNLEDHLLGTFSLLEKWNNPQFVSVAGLYHAVYGTQPMKAMGIPHNDYSPSDRPKIRKIIGSRAEALVYLYGACDRCQSSSAFMEEHRRSFIDLFDRFENSVSKKGFAEYRKIFGI